MKKVHVIFLVLNLFIQTYLACDICGCFMGIVPYDNQSSISFMHRYRVFNGYRNYQHHEKYFPVGAYKTAHGGQHADSLLTNDHSSFDYESYKVFELRAKYFIHKRWELNCFTSVVNNKSKRDEEKLSHTGLGDLTLFFAYHILQPEAEKTIKQRLIFGMGIKVPTGNYFAKDHSSERLPFLMQPGTGSVDAFSYINYVLGYKKIGFSNTSNIKYNGSNSYHERVGNSLTNFNSLFYKVKSKDWLFVPSLNSYYEFTNGLYVQNELKEGTEMNELMMGFGLDVFYKNFGLNCGIQKTIHQHYHENGLTSVGRIFVSLTYNFDQRQYLIK